MTKTEKLMGASVVAALAILLVFVDARISSNELKAKAQHDAIMTKLIELDGRRNAQYGIIKRDIETPQRIAGE